MAVGEALGDGDAVFAGVVGEAAGRVADAAGDCALAIGETVAPRISSAVNKLRMGNIEMLG